MHSFVMAQHFELRSREENEELIAIDAFKLALFVFAGKISLKFDPVGEPKSFCGNDEKNLIRNQQL